MSTVHTTRDIWLRADRSWGASTKRNGVEVSVTGVSFPRAIWHVVTVRRPDEWSVLHVVHRSLDGREHAEPDHDRDACPGRNHHEEER